MGLKSLLLSSMLISTSAFSQSVSTFYDSNIFQFTDDIIQGPDGNIYGSDYGGSNVYKMDENGVVTPFLSGLNTPNGLAFDSNDNLFAVDNQGDKIYKVDLDGNILETFDFNNPSGIIKKFDSDTMIFTGYSPSALMKLAPDGTISELSDDAALNGPVGLTYDNENRLYVANFNNRRIYRVYENSLEYIAVVPGSTLTSCGFITYANGHLYATNFSTHRVFKINPNYTDSIVGYYGSSYGTVDGTIETAKFSSPNGIRASVTGDSIFVTQYDDGAVRVMTELVLNTSNDKVFTHSLAYPNPVTTHLTVEPDYILKAKSLKIYNSTGKLIREIKNLSDQNRIDFSDQHPGNYFIEILGSSQTEWLQVIKR